MTKIDPWLTKTLEIKANGYVYPCKVRAPGSKEGTYLIEIFLPNEKKHLLVVESGQLLPRTHYNPTFDSVKGEVNRKEEFLYPIGTQVYIKEAIGKKSLGEITKYNPETSLYTVEIKLIDGGLLKLQVLEGMIEVAAVQRKPENISNEFAGTFNKGGAIPEAGKSLRADMWRAQNGYEVPGKTEVEEAYKQGDRVLVMVNEYHGKKNWMPNATIIGRDDKNIFQPAKGSKWLIRFDHSNIEWSYPENRLKLDESFYAKAEEDVNHSKYSFKKFDRVKIASYESRFAGFTGTIVENSLDKPDYFKVKLDANKAERVFPSYMLKHIYEEKEPEKEQPKEKTEEPRDREDEIIELMTGFVSSMFAASEKPIDFKQFKDRVGKIREMFK